MIGAWLRVLVNVNFNFAIVGSVFAALGGPLIYTSNCKIGANWFLPKDVVRVISLFIIIIFFIFLKYLKSYKGHYKHNPYGNNKRCNRGINSGTLFFKLQCYQRHSDNALRNRRRQNTHF